MLVLRVRVDVCKNVSGRVGVCKSVNIRVGNLSLK